MKPKPKRLRAILYASVLLILLVIQVVILQSDLFEPETFVAVYVVDVLKIFIYVNLAWLLLLGCKYLINLNKKANEKKATKGRSG